MKEMGPPIKKRTPVTPSAAFEEGELTYLFREDAG